MNKSKLLITLLIITFAISVFIGFSQIPVAHATDTTAPTASGVTTNTTIAHAVCNFTAVLADETALANYTFGCNNTGQWVNQTWTTISGASYKANYTATLNSTVGIAVEWEYWFSDSSNNTANTGLKTLVTTGYTITVTSAYGNPTSSSVVAFNDTYATSVTSPYTTGTGTQYVCVGYSVDSGDVTDGTSYTFNNIAADHTITYSWQTSLVGSFYTGISLFAVIPVIVAAVAVVTTAVMIKTGKFDTEPIISAILVSIITAIVTSVTVVIIYMVAHSFTGLTYYL